MKKNISVVIIFIGVLFILSPFIGDLVLKLSSDANRKDLDKLGWEDLEKNQRREAQFDFGSIRDVSLSRTLMDLSKFDQKLIIGQLIIPDIDLNLPVVKGVSEINLLAGAATMRADQVMGEGNYPLAGHRIRRKDTLFGGLMDIKEGSIVQLTDKKMVYEYVIYKTLVVRDTATEMLSDDLSTKRGKPIIALMTCYYSSKTGKRFFALGELVRQYPIIKNAEFRMQNAE